MILSFIASSIRGIERVSLGTGRLAAWLYPVLVLVLIGNVTLRYGFGIGSIELEELQWHLFATAFLLGFASTYAQDAHVRVDLFHARFSDRTRAWIELLGCLFLLAPFCIIVASWAVEFFWQSWLLRERSSMPSGLPGRYVIKFILFAGLSLLALQALAVAGRSFLVLRGRSLPPPGDG